MKWVGISMFKSFFYLLKEGFRGVFSHGFRAFATVTIIVACLIIMGSFSLLSINVDNIIDELESQSEMLAFVEEDWTEDDARALQPYVEAVPNVREVRFVSRGEAFASYKAQYEDQSLFEDIDESVFRSRYVVYLDDITMMEITQKDLQSLNGIADVSAYVQLAEGFVTVRNAISAVTVVLIVILLVVSIFIITNTIKLATYTRQEEIGIMKMVGASNGFIRMPFVIEGLVLGILGGGIAYFFEWGIYNLIFNKATMGMTSMLFSMIPFSQFQSPLLLIYLGAGVLVGAVGGSMAIRNYLKV